MIVQWAVGLTRTTEALVNSVYRVRSSSANSLVDLCFGSGVSILL